MTESLLPRNATRVDLALERAIDLEHRFGAQVDEITGWKYLRPLNKVLEPFLVVEYGLGDISPYFDDVAELIDEGIDWQRIRGTPAAIDLALDWIGYAAELEEAPVHRVRWNRFQLHLDRVRDEEIPDLEDIDFLAQQSVPLRSRFVRGFHGYDFRAASTSRSKLSSCLLSADSGVRIKDNGPRWSFGRPHDHDTTLNEEALRDLGVWEEWDGVIPDATDPEIPAFAPGATWDGVASAYRIRHMAWALSQLPCWVEFSFSGTVNGLRRARTVAQVIPEADGPMIVGAQHCSLGSGTAVFVEALTGFGDGDGNTATLASLRFGAAPSIESAPGLLWADVRAEMTLPLPPAALRGVTIKFGKTVRERVRTLVRIN